jgi:hypothetical protein
VESSINHSAEKSLKEHALGSLIPLRPGTKKPYSEGWSTASPEERAEAMKKAPPEANIGLPLGDYLVIDPDNDLAVAVVEQMAKEGKLPPTLSFTTWRGIQKRIYRKSPHLPQLVQSDRKTNPIHMELRTGSGHQEVLPGSIVKGKPYTWVPGHGPGEIQAADLPLETLQELLALIQPNGNEDGQITRKITDYAEILSTPMADHDGRDDTATKLVGHWLAIGVPEEEILSLLKNWNSQNKDRLTEKDLVKVLKSISKKHAKSLAQAQAEQPQGLIWPSWVMSGTAGNFARGYSQYVESSEQFLYMGYLTVLGHMICEKVRLLSELGAPPRLYLALLGESADDRKSTALKLITKFFSETVDDFDGVNILRGVGSAEGLARAFNPNPKLDGDKPPLSRILLLLDELKALIEKMKITASVLGTCVNTLFEDEEFDSLTKHHRIELVDANLCILAASTLSTYQTMFTADFLDIGLVNRFFIVIGGAERKFSIPEPLPGDIKVKLRHELGQVLAFAESLSKGKVYAMPLTPGAKAVFDGWYHNLERSVFTKRLDTYGHRLMPLLAINEIKSEIDEGIAKKVVALLDYQLAARKLADPLDADNAVAKMEQSIRRQLSVSRMKGRDLKKAVHYERAGLWVFDQAIKNLINAKEVELDKKSKFYQVIRHG